MNTCTTVDQQSRGPWRKIASGCTSTRISPWMTLFYC